MDSVGRPDIFVFDMMFEADCRLAGRSVSSQELVPGDVFEFSDPSLNQVPCDCILLSGDCIVNESMLTGSYSLATLNIVSPKLT
jgi:P-type E1-E2 ATPase